MLPYIHVRDVPIGPLTLHPFGILVALGVVIGTALTTWRAKKRGIDLARLNSFVTWMLVAGFVGGHVLDSLFYHPKEVMRDPLSLLRLWEGLSSFGGFTGGFIGIMLWKYFEYVPSVSAMPSKATPVDSGAEPSPSPEPSPKKRGFFPIVRRAVPETTMPFMDLILSVFPVAWIFGRSGCTVVHDHPGALAADGAFMSVAYPGPRDHVPWASYTSPWQGFIELYHGNQPKYDLGLMELTFTILLSLIIVATWHKRLATGTYIVVVCLAYAPVRFAMDRLRITEGDAADPRYAGFTPAQWECIVLLAAGIGVALWMHSLKKRGVDLGERILAPEYTTSTG